MAEVEMVVISKTKYLFLWAILKKYIETVKLQTFVKPFGN